MLGLCLAVGTLREHIKEIGKQVGTAIWLCSDGHSNTDGSACISIVIGEDVLAVIRFLQDASLHIVNKYLTPSHNPKSLA